MLFSPTCRDNSNTKFDTIIVLGSPATDDCKPHTIMQTRVDKAIELYKSGIAQNIIFSGSSVHNNCSESEVMATYAMSKGVNNKSIIIENDAQNTYQNAYYSVRIMNSKKFKTAAIVTSAPHIKRACIIFSKFNINYTMFSAKYPKNNSKLNKIFWILGERMILTHHIIFGFPVQTN